MESGLYAKIVGALLVLMVAVSALQTAQIMVLRTQVEQQIEEAQEIRAEREQLLGALPS